MNRVSCWIFASVVFFVPLLLSRVALAEPNVSVTAGVPEVVFSHRKDACIPLDVPDAPARAFRDQAGRVHLFTTNYINFGFVGADLNSLRRDCTVVFQGAGDANPAHFNDREWLTSFWTEDGKTVFALVHNEFHGELRPALCPSRINFECWYNAIIASQSKDGGFHFYRPADAVVAAPDTPYSPSPRRPVGYFAPSNIIERDGYYYVMIWAENLVAQKRGSCLFRTNNLAVTSSWRAWDGQEFASRMVSPYVKAAAHESGNVCKPFAAVNLPGLVATIVQHRPTGLYLAIMLISKPRLGLYVSSSFDLLNWSTARLVLDLETIAGPNCGSAPRLGYPSLIDPSSPDRNFSTVGDMAFLYISKMNLSSCKLNRDRDLWRIPVHLSVQP